MTEVSPQLRNLTWLVRLRWFAVASQALTIVVTPGRRSARLFGGTACIGHLDHGHIDRDRHREHRFHRCTSLLRHFIALTLPPCVLSSGMPSGPVGSATPPVKSADASSWGVGPGGT